MATIRRCDRIKSHIIAEDEPVYCVSPVTITNSDGEIVFEHPGFPEICQKSFEIMNKQFHLAFKMTSPTVSPVRVTECVEDNVLVAATT